jgi:hypothetical protein
MAASAPSSAPHSRIQATSRFVARPGPPPAVEDEIDVTVAARPERAIERALDRAPGDEGAGTGGLGIDRSI